MAKNAFIKFSNIKFPESQLSLLEELHAHRGRKLKSELTF
jgi:hypothetical protein